MVFDETTKKVVRLTQEERVDFGRAHVLFSQIWGEMHHHNNLYFRDSNLSLGEREGEDFLNFLYALSTDYVIEIG